MLCQSKLLLLKCQYEQLPPGSYASGFRASGQVQKFCMGVSSPAAAWVPMIRRLSKIFGPPQGNLSTCQALGLSSGIRPKTIDVLLTRLLRAPRQSFLPVGSPAAWVAIILTFCGVSVVRNFQAPESKCLSFQTQLQLEELLSSAWLLLLNLISIRFRAQDTLLLLNLILEQILSSGHRPPIEFKLKHDPSYGHPPPVAFHSNKF